MLFGFDPGFQQMICAWELGPHKKAQVCNNAADVSKFSLDLWATTAKFDFCLWRVTGFFSVDVTSLQSTPKRFVLSNNLKTQSKLRFGRSRQWGCKGVLLSGVLVSGNLRYIPGHTQPKNQRVDGHSPLPSPRSLCPVGSQPSPSDRAGPAYFQKIRLLCTTGSLIYKYLEETWLHNLISTHTIQMNRGNRVFSLYRTTSGLLLSWAPSVSTVLKLFSVTAYFVA